MYFFHKYVILCFQHSKTSFLRLRLVLLQNPITHTFVHQILRDVDFFGLFLETIVRLVEDGWPNITVFGIIKQIVMTCAHSDVMPVLETHRQVMMQLARKVLLAEIASYSEIGIVDRSNVIEFLMFMNAIVDKEISGLKFRQELQQKVVRTCATCRDMMQGHRNGGRCSSCKVIHYCSVRCQRLNYRYHRQICKEWAEVMS